MDAAGCHTPAMVASRLRALTFAGLAATSAALAHGGAAALADPAWGLPALAGAGVATAIMLAGWRLVAARGEQAAEASLAALILAMLVAQGGAHLALLASGVPAHGGSTGSLALHLALAIIAVAAGKGGVVGAPDRQAHRRDRGTRARCGRRRTPTGAGSARRPRGAPRRLPGRGPGARPAADRLTRFHQG